MLLPSLPLAAALQDEGLAKRYGGLGPMVLQPAADELSQQAAPVGLLQRQGVVLGPLPMDELEAARPWLHDGALKAIVHVGGAGDGLDTEALFAGLSALPRERLGVWLTLEGDLPQPADAEVAAVAQMVVSLAKGASTVVVMLKGAEGAAEKDVVAFGKALHQATKPRGGAPPRELVLAGPPSLAWNGATIAALHQSDVHVLAAADPAATPTLEAPLPLAGNPTLDAVGAFVACLRTDRPDGLYTTVVVDECSVALGLVYSSADSIRASVAEGRGIYYSRSRGGLWRKGDSSGAVQELVALDFDCDSDALRFIVRQRGDPPAFCHLNRRNCWRADSGLGALQRTLEARRRSAPEGSYTSRLFADPELLRHKLVEEAQELSEAQEPEHVAAEAADVLYFALVRCVAAGVTLEDVERHLDARALKLARRPGNAKPHRVEAAQAILQQQQQQQQQQQGSGGGAQA